MTGKEAKEIVQKQREYRNNYNKDHYIAFTFRLPKETMGDVIEALNNADNKTNYIVGLIRADIASKK